MVFAETRRRPHGLRVLLATSDILGKDHLRLAQPRCMIPYQARLCRILFFHESAGMKRSTTPEERPVNFYQRVYDLVRHIPRGKVMTYGQVAALLGAPHAARAVGYALRALAAGSDVPWHRVVNRQGQISPRHPAAGPILQRVLLEAEEVGFDAQDRIDLSFYRWRPET
jgi:methylated-DNA-protein-cysteine methyltransferase-like protein